MNSLVDRAVRESKTGIFTYSDVLTWFSGTRPAIRAMVTRAVASGDVLRIRRGLYCLVRDLAPFLPSEYVLANLAYGPSYVSMESALEYHGWIPEAVRTVVCVTSSRAKKFLTPFGLFKYEPVKQFPLMKGVARCDEHPSGTYFMASPLKALCDLVVTRRHDWTSCHPLVHSLRIEEEYLDSLTGEDFDCLDGVYYSKRARDFLAGIRKELGK